MGTSAVTEERPRRRAGGRSARVAKRQAPVAAAERAVRPGLVGGAYQPLSEGDMQAIYDAALELLEDVGMGLAIPEFVDVVTAAGGWVDDNGRLHYPRSAVEKAIKTAAKEFVWHALDEEHSIEISADKVHFGTGGAAVLMHDHGETTFRHSSLNDLYNISRVFDTLEHIHFFIRPVVARELEDPYALDINTAYAVIAGTTKPVGSAFFDAQAVTDSVEMYDWILGGDGEFKKRPFMFANNTFVVPPLRFAEESAEVLVAQVQAGMPVCLLSAGQAGATSPAALAGSLTQALAECLAGLTSINLMVPGHPCVMGLWPFVSDLRTGAMTGGSGEEAVLNAASAQMANWLGLPSGVAAGMSDSKLPDMQAGHEKALTVALAGHAGSNLVYEAAGMLASILAFSLEAMVIDNDMLGAINRTIRGIEVNADTLSTAVIREVIGGAGHFLGSDQTLALMQSEYIYPRVGDRVSPDDWVDAGSTSSADRAHDYVVRTLADHHPTHISPKVDEAVRRRFDIHLDPLVR